MSECNFCKLRRYKREARKRGRKITVLPDADWGMGGVNVYEHIKIIDIKKISGGEGGRRKRYWISWFAELPDTCQC